MRKGLIIGIGVTIIFVAILLFEYSIPLRYKWKDFWAKEYTVDLQLHGRYKIDTSGIREKEYVKENAPFTYFLQTIADSDTKQLLKEYGVVLPNELIANIEAQGKHRRIMLAFGRELKEVKYKFYKELYNDGVTAHAKITFCEDYEDDVMYVYFMENVFMQDADYYIIKGWRRVFLGDGVGYLNEQKPIGQQGQ